MKNFNRRTSQGHHGSKRLELAQQSHSCGSNTFTHTLLTSTQLQPLCAKHELREIQDLDSNFHFEGS